MLDTAFASTEHSRAQSDDFHGANDTLPVVAGKINAYMEKAEQSAEKARQQRVSAGQLLIEARRRVDAGEAGDTTWTEWVRNNISRSLRDCQRVMKIAGAVDPDAALAKEREDARVGMAQSRERSDKRLSCAETDHLMVARGALAAMPAEQRIEFLAEQVKALSEAHLRTFMDLVAVLGAVVVEDAKEPEKAEPPRPKPCWPIPIRAGMPAIREVCRVTAREQLEQWDRDHVWHPFTPMLQYAA